MATNGPINGISQRSESISNQTNVNNTRRTERELCKYFVNGVCRFGNSCFNSHDRSVRPSTVCRYYLLGACSFGDRCFYDHVRPKEPSNTTTTNSNSETNSKLVTRLTNKPKLLTSLEDATSTDESNESIPTTSVASSYYEALTGNKLEENSQLDEHNVNMFDENYAHYLNLKSQQSATINSLCSIYEKTLTCPYESCQFIHGNVCDMCNLACLNPFDEKQCEEHKQECMRLVEQDMEEAFAAQRSVDKVCGICMEVVWEKENMGDKRFGILENCNHIFCLQCIRKWRSSKSYENKIVKACPECRVKSDFITPSKFWFEDDENKKKIIEEYKLKLSKTACKYFKQGDGTCPFGNKCFYLHQYKDGTLADLPAPTKRHRYNREGNLEGFTNIVRIDFDFSDDEDDDFDILEFFRHSLLWDTESDSDYSDLLELSDEYLI